MSRDVTPIQIIGLGAAVPSGRLAVSDVAAGWDQKGGRGTLAVCGADEDSLTLAWSAASAALEAAALDASSIDGVWWGTARPPMPEGPTLAFLSTAIGCGDAVTGLLASGSVHAGMDALVAAWDAVVAGTVDVAMVIASDAQTPGAGTGAEKTMGAGAVALIVTADDATATARLAHRVTRVRPLLDRYRGEGQIGTGDPYDPRLYRERELLPAATLVAAALGDATPSGARWSVTDPDGRLGQAVAKKVKADVVCSDGVQGQIGDAGSAAPFLGALSGFASPGPLCILGIGGGRSTVIVAEVNAPVAGSDDAVATLHGGARGTRPVSYANALRTRGQLVPLSDPIAMGVPPGSAAFVRGNQELLSLQGRKCAICGNIAVPPSIHPTCLSCGSPEGELVSLARHGQVHTFVINHTMPPPFEAPLPLAVVDLEDGSRVMLQGLPEDALALAVGDNVELTLRRYALERGVPVYGFKVRRTVDQSSEGAPGLVGAASNGKES